MTAQSSPTTVVQDAGQANLELAESLRELATWLELHAGDLPKFTGGLYTAEYGSGARDVLSAVARALGDRAQESIDGMGYVNIAGKWGPVTVKAYASPKYLGGVEQPRPAPAYEPIIQADGISEPVSDPPCTDAEDEAWRDMEARR